MRKQFTFALVLGALFLPVAAIGQCGPPTYPCAVHNAAVIPLPNPLPDWGGLSGAGTIFTDPSFAAQPPSFYAPQYVRLTDAYSDVKCGGPIAYSSMFVDSSGDDIHFNVDDTLIWIQDEGSRVFFFGIDPETMQTGCVYASPFASGEFSQVNRNYYYNFGYDGKLYQLDMSSCQLGSGSCAPVTTQTFNYETDCNLDPSITWEDPGGIGGGDVVFANAYSASIQDTAHQALVYNSSTGTCYEYNTRNGIIRSYVKGAAPMTGTVSCDGSNNVVTWRSGTRFAKSSGDGIGWAELYMTIGSTAYDVQSVSSGTSLSVNNVCPAGTWSYSIKPGTIVGVPSMPDRFTIHNFKIDPSGKYMILTFNGTCFSQNCGGPYVWQIGTTSVSSCGTAVSCGGHWTEDAYGWINASALPDYFPSISPNFLFRSWANFGTDNYNELTQLGVKDATVNDPFDDHPSNKNDPLGTHNYPIFTNTWTPEATCTSGPYTGSGCATLPSDSLYCGQIAGPNPPRYGTCTPNGSTSGVPQYGQIMHPYSNEVFAISQVDGATYRFGHTFSSSLGPAGNLSDLSVGAPSSTGQFYAFTTDGEGTLGDQNGSSSCSIVAGNCRNDVFILKLSPP